MKTIRMKTYTNPKKESWEGILSRPETDPGAMRSRVGSILETVRKGGDRALRELTRQFDGLDMEEIRISGEELEQAGSCLRDELRQAINQASLNIEAFHAIQQPADRETETAPGVRCWIRSEPIDRVGLYIPGGSAPLISTVLMLAIPARLAGCREIILCTPPGKDGGVNPAILYSAWSNGIGKVFRVGGAQAIAAMAYGTETIPAVDKIFGPGNSFVTAAKQLVSLENVAIDMPAGPSEQAVLADASADAAFVASDLLSQAEHGPDSQVLLFTNEAEMAKKVMEELDRQLADLPRREIARKALENSRCIVQTNVDKMIEMVNLYAPEHLVIMMKDHLEVAGRIRNAGSVFLGPYTPESAGDYASGTNHTLPTGGYARAYSGLGLDSYMKKISFQEISREGLENIGPAIMEMAREEGLEAHRRSVEIRIRKNSG
jgi:histidinol dehydrogenase